MRFNNNNFHNILNIKEAQVSRIYSKNKWASNGGMKTMTQRKADFIIAIISIAWGSSYLLMKLGLDRIQPFNLIALRFGFAFMITALIFIKRVINTDKKTIYYGALLGLILFSIFLFLMFGLETTSTSAAGFLISTTVVFVPILQTILTHKKTPWPIAIGTIFTIIGIALLTLKSSFNLEIGAVLCILGAFSNAWHIIVTSHLTHKSDGLLLGIFQLGFASIYGFIFSIIFEHPVMPRSTPEWISVLGLAIICSAFGFVMQPIAQKYTTPERTGILFALEPVFAAIMGFIFLHEILNIKGYIGAILILCGVFVSSMKIDNNKLEFAKDSQLDI